MLLVRSPSLMFAHIFTLFSICFTIVILAYDHTHSNSIVHILIILPPVNCVFIFLVCGTWIERRFRVSYIPCICLILLIFSTLTCTIISTQFLYLSPLIYLYSIYHCLLCLLFLCLTITTIIAYSYGSLFIHRYRNMMTITQQNSDFPSNINLIKIDKLILKSPDNNELSIFMSILPGRRIRHDIRQLSHDLNQIQVDTILTLNEEKEFSFMNMSNGNEFDMKIYSNQIKQKNIDHMIYSIRDRFIPISISDYMEYIIQFILNLNQNHRILIHCMGGMGRTGMTVVCFQLVYEYIFFQSNNSIQKQTFIERIFHYPFLFKKYCHVCQTIQNVRTARHGTIHNPLQIWFIHEFYARLKSTSYMKDIMNIVIANEKLLSNRIDTSITRLPIAT